MNENACFICVNLKEYEDVPHFKSQGWKEIPLSGAQEHKQISFCSVLAWTTQHGIWQPLGEAIKRYIIEQYSNQQQTWLVPKPIKLWNKCLPYRSKDVHVNFILDKVRKDLNEKDAQVHYTVKSWAVQSKSQIFSSTLL